VTEPSTPEERIQRLEDQVLVLRTIIAELIICLNTQPVGGASYFIEILQTLPASGNEVIRSMRGALAKDIRDMIDGGQRILLPDETGRPSQPNRTRPRR
jgi:hypothetical protein